MTVHLVPTEVAQCVTCGGEMVPAGDDWRHAVPGGCTELGTPAICRYDDCGLPAAVGALACMGHAGVFSSPEGVGLRSFIAAV